MKVKTADLIGPALDWTVAVVEGLTEENAWTTLEIFKTARAGGLYWYSTDWRQGGPIIEREKIGVRHIGRSIEGELWDASINGEEIEGPTPLIAVMCCLVASKFGDEIEIPEELLK